MLLHFSRLNPHWQQCPFLAPFRSIPAPENVPGGSWLLDDHVLQHHPLPLHLLTHLQSFPADGWEHEVSHSLPPPASLPSLCCQSCSAAPLFLTWLIWRSLPNRDSIPVWIIISGFKSQVWPGKRRVGNPERSPSVATFFSRGRVKIRSLYHISSRFVPFIPFPSALTAQSPHCTAEPGTHTSAQRQGFISALAVCPSQGRKTSPRSQLWGDLTSACFSCLKKNQHIYLSCQREDRCCNGISARHFSILT